MNSHDQVKMHVRNAGLLILAWGIAQAAMNWPPGSFISADRGYGGVWLVTKPTGLLNILTGMGVLRFSCFAKWWGLLSTQLRLGICLIDVLDWSSVRFTCSKHVFDSAPLVVQQLIMGPFLLAQAYIIWVLTRDAVIARFEKRQPRHHKKLDLIPATHTA